MRPAATAGSTLQSSWESACLQAPESSAHAGQGPDPKLHPRHLEENGAVQSAGIAEPGRSPVQPEGLCPTGPEHTGLEPQLQEEPDPGPTGGLWLLCPPHELERRRGARPSG